MKKSWGGEVRNVSVLVAIGVNDQGYREVLGVCEGGREDGESWTSFLRHLKERGLGGIRLVTSDKSLGLLETLPHFFPEIRWQRCVVHFYRNVYSAVPRGKAREVALMLKAIHSQEDLKAAREKAEAVVEKLEAMKLRKAATIVKDGCEETLSYFHFPSEHWKRLRTNNALERLNREIRRRTKVVGNFPDGESALMLVSARVRHVASTKRGKRAFMNIGVGWPSGELPTVLVLRRISRPSRYGALSVPSLFPRERASGLAENSRGNGIPLFALSFLLT